MFDPCPHPRLFGLPPGADFARALVIGMRARMKNLPPEAMARVELYVNTRRMQRRIQSLFVETGAGLLPRIRLLGDLSPTVGDASVPPSRLRRKLELAQLVRRLIAAQPDLAPDSAAFDLADSLLALLEEMQGEGVAPDVFHQLDVTDQSGHWDRALQFLRLIAPYFDSVAMDAEAQRRQATKQLIATWQDAPPAHPIIVAGSTGSRGTTQLLMRAVAGLPQGALVLPGFDFDQPNVVWDEMRDAMVFDDHPQFRFAHLLQNLGIGPQHVSAWVADQAPCGDRNALISLSLRPAPVTDRWMSEGPRLNSVSGATDRITLIEAPTSREEAGAIALRLRQAAEDGQKAALISPDRQLTRQVTAALDRWRIKPDDSAGRPLSLSAPGRYLRHVAALFGQRLTSEALLTLLKHPLTNTGSGARGNHLLWTRELELWLRKEGVAFPSSTGLLHWAEGEPDRTIWAEWLTRLLEGVEDTSAIPLADHLTRHINLSDSLSAGPGCDDAGELWLQTAGREARDALSEMVEAADAGGVLGVSDYVQLLNSVLQGKEVRNPDEPHPGIMILGTLEARAQGADLVILGGLNDGIWPQQPAPDPWLNRKMRKSAGLLLPERRIGLSAHDYQQAAGAAEIWLTRSVRDAEAETVPSRWLNRLTGLLGGLPDRAGSDALVAMRGRGQYWLKLMRDVENPSKSTVQAPRPAPRPPVKQRPRRLSVTQIKTLIRDPFAIYARHILNLRKLNPIRPTPDAPIRGTILHKILERFIAEGGIGRDDLLRIAEQEFSVGAPWPTAQCVWLAKLDKAADWFLETEAQRQILGTPLDPEQLGKIALLDVDFTLSAKADRFDRYPDGSVWLYDYKTGTPPSPEEQRHFDKQLLLQAAMVERGGFERVGASTIVGASFIGLGANPKQVDAPLEDPGLDQVWSDFHSLIRTYFSQKQGYLARRAVAKQRFEGDYDHLARFGEWDDSDAPMAEEMP